MQSPISTVPLISHEVEDPLNVQQIDRSLLLLVVNEIRSKYPHIEFPFVLHLRLVYLGDITKDFKILIRKD